MLQEQSAFPYHYLSSIIKLFYADFTHGTVPFYTSFSTADILKYAVVPILALRF